jgi:hypothetical protein
VLAKGAARLDVRVDQHAPADPLAPNAGTDRVHDSRYVTARNSRHSHRQAGHALEHEDVEVVEAAGLDGDHRLVGAGRGLGPVRAELDLVEAAVRLDRDRAHRYRSKRKVYPGVMAP